MAEKPPRLAQQEVGRRLGHGGSAEGEPRCSPLRILANLEKPFIKTKQTPACYRLRHKDVAEKPPRLAQQEVGRRLGHGGSAEGEPRCSPLRILANLEKPFIKTKQTPACYRLRHMEVAEKPPRLAQQGGWASPRGAGGVQRGSRGAPPCEFLQT